MLNYRITSPRGGNPMCQTEYFDKTTPWIVSKYFRAVFPTTLQSQKCWQLNLAKSIDKSKLFCADDENLTVHALLTHKLYKLQTAAVDLAWLFTTKVDLALIFIPLTAENLT